MSALPLRILVVAPLRFPIARLHSGGLESVVWNEVRALRERGHQVDLIAARGSDFLDDGPPEFVLDPVVWTPGDNPTDDSYPVGYLSRSGAGLGRALDLVADSPGRWDVMSNHCLHPLPVLRAGDVGVPVATTLHTPVDPDVVLAAAASSREQRFLAVSEYTRQRWARAGVYATVLQNGVEVRDWPLGPGGPGLVWFGRIVPEKAPHLAIEVARRLRRPLTLAGRVGDPQYAEQRVLPRLGHQVQWAGHLGQTDLARLLGTSGCALMTPLWPEPFGLVAPESLMCGTPVAAFAAGGVPEIARLASGMSTVPRMDLEALTHQADEQLQMQTHPPSRARIRAKAAASFSLDTRIEALEAILRQEVAAWAPADAEVVA